MLEDDPKQSFAEFVQDYMFKRPTDRHSPKASNLYESPVLGAQMEVEHRIEDSAESRAARKALPAISSSEKKRVLTREEKKQMFSINIAQCQR